MKIPELDRLICVWPLYCKVEDYTAFNSNPNIIEGENVLMSFEKTFDNTKLLTGLESDVVLYQKNKYGFIFDLKQITE